MGQGSSQPMNGGLSEPESQGRDAVGYSSSSSPKISKKVKSELQVEGTPAPKRKRKQTVNNTNNGMPSDTPNQSQVSPLNQADPRPMKRTKVAPSTANTKEARKPEKNDTREAIPSPEATVIANNSEAGKFNLQSMDVQPLTDVAHTNGTSSKKPKNFKARTTQQEEGKEVSTLPQSPVETKTISMASANPSLADSSTDQKDSTDTSAARGPRKGKKDKMIGFFAASEVSALETFKLEFCNEHGISSERFDRMVQHVDRRKDSGWPCDESIIKKPDFWQQIYDVLPGRDRRSVYRFMRRHFQDSSQKPHHWTHEQDDELIDLVGRYGPKFAHIAKILGRVEDDVVQRWKNRLEHRSTMRRGAWSEEEARGLLNALQASWNNLKKDGQDVGRDIYEMDEGLVSWGQVSNKLQNCRSRQQCADKWRKIRRKVMGQRSTGNQNAVYDPATEAKPQGRAKSITLAEQMEMERMYKSSEYVDSEDGEEEDMEQSAGTESQSPKKPPKQITKIKDEGESAEKKPTIMSAPEKPPATSAKALNKGSQSNESQTEIDDSESEESEPDSAESTSDDASEAETKPRSGSGSDSDFESSDESDAKVDAKTIAQPPNGQEKGIRNNKAPSAKTSSKPTKPTPNQKLVDRSKPKTSDDQQPKGQATKTSASDSSAKAETNAISRAKASKPSHSTTEEEEVLQETSFESESDSESGSDSSSDSEAESEAESTSSSEEPSNRQPTKVAPKAPTSIGKASVKEQVSQKTQNDDDSEENSSTSDETSSSDNSTEASESDDDSGSDSDSISSPSDDKPVKSPKAAALKGTKRKAQEPAQQTGKTESKRLKTGQKPSKKSSSPSSSDRSSSEDSESEGESDSRASSLDSDSEADTDESVSASDSSDSTSKPQPQPQPKSKSKSKQPTARPKVPKAVNGQEFELSKSGTPAISKEGSNAKNGQSGPKQKLKQVKPTLPQVKKDGEKKKGKPGSTPVSKAKKSK
ncbi:MYB DNA-binding domain protein [Aspergillus thermomutatus]|uniref:RNA polymerase I enhancer binding protein n=1 Tax=Aspergillus thermomutatus TaxID=41047 RepID=A0A397HYC5_ASPTH|nr:uncharacterized protein CDV56_106848 [Aspergillus thermomutatus]RHZ68289.1 hypothetical protein CDV56_106848 [Aspergillus thermomutatus]